MKHDKIPCLSRSACSAMTRLLAMFFLLCSCGAQATAPRITGQMFGEEKKADIVGYQSLPMDATAKSESALAMQIVTEAFKAAGKTPTVDLLPSKQLAKYALLDNNVVALLGSPQDLTEQEKNQYRVVTFFLKGSAPGEEPVSLIFSKKNARGDELHQAFNEGLQKILKNGKYLEILEKDRGKGQVPSDYVNRLKRHNPGWK